MESESIVDYLKSSLGKPWPLIANSSQPNFFGTPSPQPSQTTPITTTTLTTTETTTTTTTTTSTTNSTPKQDVNTPQSPFLSSPPIDLSETQIDNQSATHLNGLYPEWDEFYLLVCDICGIIIRPQALGKHLATKHQVDIQQQQQNNHQSPNNNKSLPTNQKTITTNKSTSKVSVTNTLPNNNSSSKNNGTNNINGNKATTNNCNTTNNNNSTSKVLTNGTSSLKSAATPTTYQQQAAQPKIPPKVWGGKHALDSMPRPAIKRRPCDWMKVRRAPDTNPETLSQFLQGHPTSGTSPPPTTSLKYQDSKWRITFNVLKDAFF